MKKFNLSIIISIIAFLISAFALYLSFINYKDSKEILFTWKVSSRNDIPVKLEQEKITNEDGTVETNYFIPIWLEYKVANTGLRTFSVDEIWVTVNNMETGRKLTFKLVSFFMNRDYSDEIPEKEKMILPVAFEPGISKVMLSKFNLPITEELYDQYKRKFKDEKFTIGDIFRSSRDLHISSNYSIFAEVTLAGGERKVTRVSVDEGI